MADDTPEETAHEDNTDTTVNGSSTKKRAVLNLVSPEKIVLKKNKQNGQTNVASFFADTRPSLKPSVYLSAPKEVLDLMIEPMNTLSLKHIGFGLFTLFIYNRWGSNQEAFNFPIVRSEAVHEHDGYNKKEKRFIQETKIWAVVPRRQDKKHNEPIYKIDPKTGGKFKECYFLSSMEDKRPDYINGNGAKKVQLKTPFDETDPNAPQSLDNYITDEAIVSLLQKVWHCEVDKTFYTKSKKVVRDVFFSKPYPEIANFFFGYPLNDDDEDKIQDEQQKEEEEEEDFHELTKEQLEELEKVLDRKGAPK